MPISVTIDPTGRLTFELGPRPKPQLVELARELAAAMGGRFIAEAVCSSPEEREAIAQRLAALLLRGGAS
jgi:hypothetical protein